MAAVEQLEKFEITLEKGIFDPHKKKKKRKRLIRIISMIFLLALTIILVLYLTGGAHSPLEKAAYILGRTVLILILWYVILAPIFMKIVKNFLSKKNSTFSKEVDQVFALLPYMQKIISTAWKETIGFGPLKRVKEFIFLALMYCLHALIPES